MSDELEPAAKKAKTVTDNKGKTGWEGHTLNVSEAIMKADEKRHFADLIKDEVATIQGIGLYSARVLEALKLKTVEDLATYKFFLIARAIKTLAEYETEDGRLEGALMNVDKAVDKEYETKTLKEICKLPIGALEGLTDEAGELLKAMGVTNVEELAEFKYCKLAEALVQAAKVENVLTEKERKVQAQLKKLA